MSGSIDDRQPGDSQADAPSSPSNSPESSEESRPKESRPKESRPKESRVESSDNAIEADWAAADRILSSEGEEDLEDNPEGRSPDPPALSVAFQTESQGIPLAMVETAFLASTASLLWLVSYYLSIGAWMRIFFPAPIALVYLRWRQRAAWMSALVACLLLSVLMGPYLSLLFLVPYGLLGVQLGALWRRGASWALSITLGTLVSTFSFFFRLWLLSAFLGEDLWVYLTGRITDLLEWVSSRLVDWGILGIGMLGQPDVTLVQIATVVMVITSDLVYLFTVHLTVWLLFERLGNPIPAPPMWVQILLEEE